MFRPVVPLLCLNGGTCIFAQSLFQLAFFPDLAVPIIVNSNCVHSLVTYLSNLPYSIL